MKRLMLVLFSILGLVVCLQAQPLSDSYIFPVIGDNTAIVYHNTLDPRLGEATNLSVGEVEQPIQAATLGGWFDIGNAFGHDCPSCLGPSTYRYHPGTDLNRYDKSENTGNNEPVLSIGDGTVIRIKSTSYGWAVIIRYDFPNVYWVSPGDPSNVTVNLSDYVYPGTSPSSVIQNATGIIVMYQHLSNNILLPGQNNYRPNYPEQTLTVSKGQPVGYIDSNQAHLHFEMRAFNPTIPYITASVTAFNSYGYYTSLQELTDYNHIDGMKFLNEFMVGWYKGTGWNNVNGVSSQFKIAYDNNGGYASLGSIWDRTSQVTGDKYCLVHNWPDGGGPEVLNVQDFLQITRDEHGTTTDYSDDTFEYTWSQLVNKPGNDNVYLVTDEYNILSFWHNNIGYTTFGAPTSEQQDLGTLVVQNFEKGLIEHDKSTDATVGRDLQGFQIALEVNNYTQIFSDPLGAGIWNDLSYLGTTPYTLFLGQGETMDFTAKLQGYNDEPFTVSWNDGGQIIMVNLISSTQGASYTDLMAITPGFLDFGSTKNNLTFTISKETTPHDLTWNATPSKPWITCTPPGGIVQAVPVTGTVHIDYTQVSGLQEESIAISSTAGIIHLPIILDANSQWSGSPVTYDFSALSQLDDWLLIDGTPDSSGINNGALKLHNGGQGTTSSWSEAYLTAAGSIFDDVSMTFTFDNGASESSNQVTDIRLCFVDKNNYYTWQIKEDNRSGSGRSYTKLMRHSSGGETDLTQEYTSLPSGTYTASYSNGVMRLVDDQGGLVFDQSVNVGTGLYGRAGFATNEEAATFDNVSIDGATANFLMVDKLALDYGTELVNETMQITGLGGESVSWQVSSKPSWLNTNVSSGTTLVSIVCSANRSVLTTGIHTGNLVLSSGGGSRTIPVSVDVPKLLFSDDFSGGINVPWSIPKPNWSIVSGELKQTQGTGQRAVVMNQAGGNVAMEVDWYQTGASGNRLSFFYIHANSDLSNYYRVTVDKAGNTLQMEKKVSGNAVMMLTESAVVPHGRYRIAVKNDTLYFSGLDAGSAISFSAYDATLGSMPQGYHGVGLDGDEVYIDNIEIYDLDNITPPNTPVLVTPSSQNIGSASSGTLSDSLLFQSTGTAVVVGTITATGNISMDSAAVNLTSGLNRKYELTVNLDALPDGSYSDTIKVSYSGKLETTVVTYEKSATPSTVLGLWYMDGSLGSNAKRTNEVTGALLTEVGVSSTTGHACAADEAYNFNGSSYLVTDLDTELNSLDKLTIAAWIKTDVTNAHDQIMGRWGSGAHSFILNWFNDSRMYFYVVPNVNDGGGSSNAYAALSRDTGWHHYVMVYDGTAPSVQIYYDGAVQTTTITGTIPATLTNAGSTPLIIGNYEQSTSGPPHTGAIDYVQLDNSAWTASQVSDDYQSGLAKRSGYNDEYETISDLPTVFALHPNFPNPFNPTTTIKFDLSEETDVTLKIYNILGQEVTTLINGRMEAGFHKTIWNGQNSYGQQVASGIYICRMVAGDFTSIQKMLLTK